MKLLYWLAIIYLTPFSIWWWVFDQYCIVLCPSSCWLFPVWFVAEPTEGLDAANEAKVMDNVIHQRRKGQTIIAIAHRLSSIKDADRSVSLHYTAYLTWQMPCKLPFWLFNFSASAAMDGLQRWEHGKTYWTNRMESSLRLSGFKILTALPQIHPLTQNLRAPSSASICDMLDVVTSASEPF